MNKWEVRLDDDGNPQYIFSGDFIICDFAQSLLPSDIIADRANATLIVEAVNACKEVNENDPLKVAQSIKGLVEGLKKLASNMALQCSTDYLYKHNLSLPLSKLQRVLTDIEGK